jgi:hypothetical protein
MAPIPPLSPNVADARIVPHISAVQHRFDKLRHEGPPSKEGGAQAESCGRIQRVRFSREKVFRIVKSRIPVKHTSYDVVEHLYVINLVASVLCDNPPPPTVSESNLLVCARSDDPDSCSNNFFEGFFSNGCKQTGHFRSSAAFSCDAAQSRSLQLLQTMAPQQSYTTAVRSTLRHI